MANNRRAFTILELMLAMAFLGTMLVGIAALMMRITSIYQKGLSLRAINSTGREIISDLTRSINGSPTNQVVSPADNTINTDDNKDISSAEVKEAYYKYYNSVEGQNAEGKNVQLGGVFCTGAYSYIWNTADSIKAYRLNDSAEDIIRLKVPDSNEKVKTIVPKFVRIADRDRSVCENQGKNNNYALIDSGDFKEDELTFNLGVKGIHEDDVYELIGTDESDIALYDFTILPATQNDTTKQIFFSGTFIIATIRGGVNINANGDFCTGEDKSEGEEFTKNDFDYCAVNKFNFAARATGEASIKQYGSN